MEEKTIRREKKHGDRERKQMMIPRRKPGGCRSVFLLTVVLADSEVVGAGGLFKGAGSVFTGLMFVGATLHTDAIDGLLSRRAFFRLRIGHKRRYGEEEHR